MLQFWDLLKINIFFRTLKPNCTGSFKFPWHGFCKIATVKKNQRQANMEDTYCSYIQVVKKLLVVITKNMLNEWYNCFSFG